MGNWLKRTYEQLFDNDSGEMLISRGKIYSNLGMILDFTVPGKVKIAMISYVKEIVQMFSEHDSSKSTANTPARSMIEPHPSPNSKQPSSTILLPSICFSRKEPGWIFQPPWRS
jgi:hypothetical protein